MYRRIGHLGAYISDGEANVSTQLTNLIKGKKSENSDANNHMYVRVTGEIIQGLINLGCSGSICLDVKLSV